MLKWVLLAWLVFMVAVPLWALAGTTKVKFEPHGARPEDKGGTNYLVVGSDARKGLPGRRTDTIMVLHTGKGPNVLMSIPRDSIVDVPGHGTTKINASFAYGGPRLLTRTVEKNTRIHVDDYVEIGFNGFVSLVDAVGGIQICPKKAIKDKLAHLDVRAGCQEADGKTALGYSRSRHAFALGDIERAQHQREVVSAIGHEVLSWKTVVNPVRYFRVVTGGARSVRLGESTGPVALAEFAVAMNRVNGKSGLTCGVPIADLAVNWDQARSERLFTLIRENRADEIDKKLCTPTGRPQ
jgi:LCP family protein required for cell wall assembly